MSIIVSRVRTSALTRRPSRLVYSASIALIAGSMVLSACGGSDDANDDDGPEAVVATFTPAPHDFTPEAAQTRIAQETAFAQTATAQPTSAAPQGSPSGSPSIGDQRPDRREGEVRPPDLIVNAEGGQEIGEIGAFLWFDEATQTVANIQLQTAAPYPDTSPAAPEGSTITLTTPNSPYAIESSGVFLYSFQDNIAIPTDPQGNEISDEPGFVPINAPVWQTETVGGTISVRPDVPPGDYILYARVAWIGPDNVEQQIGGLFTTYTFRVTIT